MYGVFFFIKYLMYGVFNILNTLYVFITFAHTKTLYVLCAYKGDKHIQHFVCVYHLCAYKGDKHIQRVKHIQNTLYVFITFVCAKVINTYKVFAHTCLHHTQHVLITLKVTNTYLRIHVYIFAHTCIQVINTYKVYGDQHIHDAYVEPRHERWWIQSCKRALHSIKRALHSIKRALHSIKRALHSK